MSSHRSTGAFAPIPSVNRRDTTNVIWKINDDDDDDDNDDDDDDMTRGSATGPQKLPIASVWDFV